jgi:hypothetical protein
LKSWTKRGHKPIIFVDSRAVKELMEQTIAEKGLRVYIKDYFGDRAGLQSHGVEPGDVVLLFDGSSEGVNGISRGGGIPRDQILSLW